MFNDLWGDIAKSGHSQGFRSGSDGLTFMERLDIGLLPGLVAARASEGPPFPTVLVHFPSFLQDCTF